MNTGRPLLGEDYGVSTTDSLARLAGVLVTAGLLAEQRQGRRRYLRLADHQAAQLVEDLAAVVAIPDQPASLRAVRASRRLIVARTCYDHLAGALGVALFNALVDRALIGVRDGLVLTPAGRTWFVHLAGPDVLRQTRRPLLRTCLDWTERRNHLGGVLGAALCTQLLERGWLARTAQHRAVTITAEGSRALADLLDLDAHALTICRDGLAPFRHQTDAATRNEAL